MEKCPKCKRKFPDGFVNICIVDNTHTKLCPLCYAEEYKRTEGFEWEPRGEIASELYEEAKELYPNG